jgi:uncharacterized protein
MSKVSWFEMSADDPKRAMDFYEEVFGWKFQKLEGGDYWLATAGDEKEMGINGAIMPRKPQTPPVVNTINVVNIDEAIQRIEKKGGKIAVPKMEVAMAGTLAYFLDTEGNMHGILQPKENMKM